MTTAVVASLLLLGLLCLESARASDILQTPGYGRSDPGQSQRGGIPVYRARPGGGGGGSHAPGGGGGGPPEPGQLYKTTSVHFRTPSGGGPGVPRQTGEGPVELVYNPSPYAFDYTVNNYESGAQFSANENSDGEATSGFYKVALPDGRIQTVTYKSDPTGGFRAEVSYEGEAVYPERAEYALHPDDYGVPGSAPRQPGRGPSPGIGAAASVGFGGGYGGAAPRYRPSPGTAGGYGRQIGSTAHATGKPLHAVTGKRAAVPSSQPAAADGRR